MFSSISSSTGQVLHRETLRKSELDVCSAFLTDAQEYFHDNELRMYEVGEDWRFSYLGSRFDATNVDANKGTKYQVLECDARYVYDDGKSADDLTLWVEPSVMDKCATDNDCFEATLRQLASVKCPAFEDPLNAGMNHNRRVRTIVVTTDGGEKGTRKKMASAVSSQPRTLFIDNDCVHHQQSNMSKTSLHHSDDISIAWGMPQKPFPTVVKGYHIWRKLANSISDIFPSKYPHIGHAMVKKLPERPVVGRWGTEHNTSGHFLTPRPIELITVMKHAHAATKNKSKKRNAPSGQPIDETALDEQCYFHAKWNKWEHDFFIAVEDKRFWILQRIGFKARSPFQHLHFYLQTNKRGKLADFVTNDCDRIWSEINNLLDHDWSSVVQDLEDLPEPEWMPGIADVLEAAITLTTCHAGDWHRRCNVPCNTLPRLLLWYGKKPRNQFCIKRLSISNMLISTPDAPEVTAWPQYRKFMDIFGDHVLECKRSCGLCPAPLHAWSANLAMQQRACTQEAESTIKIVTEELHRAPVMRSRLLKARVVNTKKVRADHNTEAAMSANMAALTDIVCSTIGTDAFNAVNNDPSRYADIAAPLVDQPSPGPTAKPICDRDGDGAATVAQPKKSAKPNAAANPDDVAKLPDYLQPHQSDLTALGLVCGDTIPAANILWAHGWNLDLYRAWRHRTAKEAFGFTKPHRCVLRDRDPLWLYTVSHGYEGLCIRCFYVAECNSLRITRPLSVALSSHILAMQRHCVPCTLSKWNLVWKSSTEASLSNRKSLFKIIETHPKRRPPTVKSKPAISAGADIADAEHVSVDASEGPVTVI